MEVHTADTKDVWLVKVPKYMANAWKNAPTQARLGTLQFPKKPNGEKIQFISNDQEGVPKVHTLALHPLTHQRMAILAQDKDKISFEGDVKQRGELRPIADTSYMNLKSHVIKEAAKPTRVTQILDKAVTSYKPRGAAQLAHEADLRKRKEEAKKVVREDKDVVQGRLFAAFEKQQYYNIKDLVRITNQSIPYLKEILKEICNYCSKSTHKNMWELKPEYRHYKKNK